MMTGNFEAEKEDVRGEMHRRLYYLYLSLQHRLASMVWIGAEQNLQDVVYWI